MVREGMSSRTGFQHTQGHTKGCAVHVCAPSSILLPGLTCQHLAELPRDLGVGRWAGFRGPSAPDQMLLSTEWGSGSVEGLDQHLLLPKLDEAHLPRKERQTGHEPSSLMPARGQEPEGSRATSLWPRFLYVIPASLSF